MATYTYLIEGLASTTKVEAVIVINPSGSGVKMTFVDATMVSLAQTCEFEIKRYTYLPILSGGATVVPAYKTDTTQVDAKALVYIDPAMDTSSLTKTWQRDVQTLLDDAGDDTSVMFYVPDDFKPILNEGEAITITLPDGSASYDINIMIKEV